MEAVIEQWLYMNYNSNNTTKFEPPTWKALIAAVAHPLGGNNKTEAKRIASKHKVGEFVANIAKLLKACAVESASA